MTRMTNMTYIYKKRRLQLITGTKLHRLYPFHDTLTRFYVKEASLTYKEEAFRHEPKNVHIKTYTEQQTAIN